MSATLNDRAKALLGRPVFASLATVAPDGSPQVTPVWIDVDGDDVLFNTADGRAKAVNIRRNPQVGLSVFDPDDPYGGVVSLRGKVTEITTAGADAHIDAMAKKYMGLDEYPLRQPGEVRLKIRITPERVAMQPGG